MSGSFNRNVEAKRVSSPHVSKGMVVINSTKAEP